MQDDDADPRDLSDAESFTLKDRQLAINQTHPFGMRYGNPRSIRKTITQLMRRQKRISIPPRVEV